MQENGKCSNVIEYLESDMKLYPDKIAVAMGDRGYTFFELYQKVRMLSSAIDCENKPIAVIADRSVDTILFFLAVAYSGNFYVPVDPEIPKGKMSAILEEIEPEYVFCLEKDKKILEAIDRSKIKILDIDSSGKVVHEHSGIAPEDPLYMVYTSGSTGKPKGVLKSHGAMINFIESFVEAFELTEHEIIGNQTPFYFDASAKDIYLMLKTGARLEIIPAELFVMPPRLIGYLNEKKISYICWVPTALVLTAQIQAFKYIVPQYLKTVCFVGEVMPVKYLNYWMEKLSEVKYVNLYGQSEICGIACYYEISEIQPIDSPLPIGTPLSGYRVILRDGNRTIVRAECSGEIWIAGKALAEGYYKDEEKTNERFVVMDGTRYFRTGDYAYYDHKGNLVFTARQDSQIKHLGRRIELGEIETAAGSYDRVERCCCLYDSEQKQIVLFCQGQEADKVELRKFLGDKLASYMVPGMIVFLEKLPVNQNGKIDRQKLKADFLERSSHYVG